MSALGGPDRLHVVRLLAAGIALLVVVVMIAAITVVSSRTHQAKSERMRSGSTLVRTLNQLLTSPAPDSESWVVTRANSAHQAMVVEVDAPRLEDAQAIAAEIVEPMQSRGYLEILVYVRRRGSAADAPIRRIQWTPNGGFVDMEYGARR